MKGTVGFLVGIIGFCFFTAVSIVPLMIFRRGEGPVIFIIILVVAFVFLNILVVGFYRSIQGLHDSVLYPDDPYSQPLRGRGLFFTGYVGLLVALVLPVVVAVLQEVAGFRIRGRELDVLFGFAWFVGWVFTGCLLGGILMLLHDIHHKAFYRTMVHRPDDRYGDDLDISRRGPRRPPRGAGQEQDRPRQRQWEE